MKKLKIIVYAICKNEEKFVNRWVDSMQEADEIIVLDTGSTDQTVDKLKQRGVQVYEKKIYPWRFDTARNESLALVPNDADICVCTDLDETFIPGWRDVLEQAWLEFNPTRARYNYNWKLDEQDNPLVNFWINKIHTRKDYHWKNPVHEVLSTNKEEREIEVQITLNHYPDATKSRSSYLPLLEISVEEEPENDRNLHYLGREYMFYQKWDKCIETLHKHLTCKNATWKDERCASMRFLGRAYEAKGYMVEAECWWKKAIEEAPHLREGYIELASLYIKQDKYLESYDLLQKAYAIKEKSKSYINEEFAWNDAFYDIFSLAAFYTGHYQENLALMLPYSQGA